MRGACGWGTRGLPGKGHGIFLDAFDGCLPRAPPDEARPYDRPFADFEHSEQVFGPMVIQRYLAVFVQIAFFQHKQVHRRAMKRHRGGCFNPKRRANA